MDSPGRLADTISAHLSLMLEVKQHVLELDDAQVRLEHVMKMLEGEIDVMQIEKKIRGRVKQQMEKNQREYYLNEQIMMPAMSAEATVVRNYLDVLTNVPWKKRTKSHIDLKACQDKLDADHYGREKIKE